MPNTTPNTPAAVQIHVEIAGASALVGRTISIDEWAEEVRVPDRKNPGQFLSGQDVQRITGIENKSWDPHLFRDFDSIVRVSREALQGAALSPNDIDTVVLATTMPYEAQIDADAFRFMRALRIPDHVAPIQLHAGCAGLARAVNLVGRMRSRHTLIVGYQVSSLYLNSPLYLDNEEHPMGSSLWYSPAFFSDGAAAMVLRQREQARGCAFYSRDSLAFGDEPGFADPLIHCPGGGAMHPPGTPGSEALSCAGMNGKATKAYYAKGMMLNHETLAQHRPDYLEEIARIYTHQASPRLVDAFVEQLLTMPKANQDKIASNTRKYGNLVIPSTMTMLSEDLSEGRVGPGDEVCFSVVGSGPERGAFILPIA